MPVQHRDVRWSLVVLASLLAVGIAMGYTLATGAGLVLAAQLAARWFDLPWTVTDVPLFLRWTLIVAWVLVGFSLFMHGLFGSLFPRILLDRLLGRSSSIAASLHKRTVVNFLGPR